MRGQKPVEDVWKEWNDLLLHICIGMPLPKFPKLRDRLGALSQSYCYWVLRISDGKDHFSRV